MYRVKLSSKTLSQRCGPGEFQRVLNGSCIHRGSIKDYSEHEEVKARSFVVSSIFTSDK